MKILTDNPAKLLTLGDLTDMSGAAKSTLSEDIDIIDEVLQKFDMGYIESVSGASGGIRYMPSVSGEKADKILKGLCEELSKKERILAGGYLYMLDIIYNPEKISELAQIFAGHFSHAGADYVITVETKGIPLAFMTAKYLNVPLVIVRHNSQATDGSSVNVNYLSGSSKRIQTMVLPTKALKRGSKLLFIDDFMKGGGTAKGITELAKEFECELTGIGVLIETRQHKKLVEKYFSLLTLNFVDEEAGIIEISPVG
jgi:purine operon repressor